MKRVVFFALSASLLVACSGADSDPEPANPLGVELSELAELCVHYRSCAADHQRVGICISSMTLMAVGTRWEFGLYTSLHPGLAAALLHRDCVMNSGGDCEQILDCISDLEVTPGCENESRCIGDELFTCMSLGGYETNTEIMVDCAAVGLECVAWGPRAFCAEKSDYSGSDYRVRCDGKIALVEHEGVRYGDNCGLVGARCNPGTYTDEMGWRSCVGTGADCEEGESEGCEGNHFVTCVGGKMARIDCTVTGSICGVNPDGRESCINPGDCDPYGLPRETCEAGTVGFCGLDGWEEWSCPELGYSDCETTEGARCVP